MNKWQKGVLGNRVEEDEKILKRLKKTYAEAEKSIDEKIEALLARMDATDDASIRQSIAYQKDYQMALKKQISGILDELNANQFNDISEYLEKSYENGFIGTMYDLQGQGIPLICPIDQERVVRVLKNNSKLSKGLWGSLYDRNSALQNKLRAELSRGISQGYSYAQITKSVSDQVGVNYNAVARIVRTESNRIANEAAMDAQYKAKDAGADIVKQWDATMDGNTRPEHRELDGQIRDLDKPFTVGAHEAQYPGGFGVPWLDINCRCAVLQRAKWALDEDELETLKERAAYFGLDKTESFEDYKKKYLSVIESQEFKNPYFGKTFSLTPDGTEFVEGEVFGADVYEIDWDGKHHDMFEDMDLIMDNDTGELIPKSALKKVKEGEKFADEVWTMNPDGTFTKGAIKHQAQYKIDVPNNQILSLDISDALENTHEIFENSGGIAIYDTIYEALPEQLRSQFDALYNDGDDPKQILKKVLENNDYKGLNIVNNSKKYGDLVENYLDIFDDALIAKTKKSKLETLSDSLVTAQKKLDKMGKKTFSGIWPDDVSVYDYPTKKVKIQAKKQYYNEQIAMLDPSDPKVAQFKKYLDDLDEFEKFGQEYEAALAQVNKIKGNIAKHGGGSLSGTTSTQFDVDAYSDARKNAANWFDPADYDDDRQAASRAADNAYRDKSGKVWRNADEFEKDSIHDYTGSYHKYNEPLRGIEYGTSKYLGVGNVDMDMIGVNYSGYAKGEIKKRIDAITSIINKSSYEQDMWLQRGVNYGGMDKFFGIDPGDFYLPIEQLRAKLLGTTPTEHAFMSTAVVKGSGFDSCPIILNIYAPKGTKMMYLEPFSQFGHGSGRRWDGKSGQNWFGSEIEMLLQRGTRFHVTKVDKKGGKIFIDMEVVGQLH